MPEPSNSTHADGAPHIQFAAALGKTDFLLIRSGGGDLEALKKARARFNRLNAKIPHDPGFDTVAEVRKYRDGLAR